MRMNPVEIPTFRLSILNGLGIYSAGILSAGIMRNWRYDGNGIYTLTARIIGLSNTNIIQSIGLINSAGIAIAFAVL